MDDLSFKGDFAQQMATSICWSASPRLCRAPGDGRPRAGDRCVWLASLGGSPYYVLASLLVGGSAALLWTGRRQGVWLYAAMLAGTVCWSVWEAGFDGWALAARLGAPFVLGAWLVTPWLRRRLSSGARLGHAASLLGFAATLVIAVARGGASGERLSPTQPFSVGMPSFRGPDLNEGMMWGLTPIDQMVCRIRFRQARYDGPFTPPGLDPAVVYPGNLGGTDWGGIAVDPKRQIMIIPSDRVANYDRLIARDAADTVGIKRNDKVTDLDGPLMAQEGTPFAAIINPFLSALGAPCQQPPYGTLTAVDLNTHRVIWTRRLGTARDSGPLGLRSMLPIPMGTPVQGGSLITASGLVFIGATQERSFRAVDIASGRTLWEVGLPAGGQATPITYSASGRQFVVIPAGGNTAIKSGLGDSIIAYALPAGSNGR